MKPILKTIRALVLLMSCGPFVHAQTANVADGFILFVNKKELPVDARYVGKVNVTDKGFKLHCTLPEVIGEAQEKAGKIGGNIINITSLREPDGWSTCYRIKADVYHMNDVVGYWKRHRQLLDSFLDNALPDTVNYGLAFIYVNTLLDAKPVSDLKVNDSIVGRLKSFKRYSVWLKPGKNAITVTSVPTKTIYIDVQPRKVYYLQCNAMNGSRMLPEVMLVGHWEGYHKFHNLREDQGFEIGSKKDTSGVKIIQ